MSQLRALLYKEWRDQRVFAGCALGVCLLLSLTALPIPGYALMKSAVLVDSVLPVCCLIFTVVLATESIARDAQGRVSDTLLRVPASRLLVWSAKLLFVGLAVCALILMLLPIDFVLTRVGASPRLDGQQALARTEFWALAAALAGASFAFACVLRRAMTAAIFGMTAIAALPLFAAWVPQGRIYDRLYVFLTFWTPTELACVLCVAFLLGSLLAFASRRSDPLGWRRGLAAFAGAVLVIAPAVAGSVGRASAGLDIAFADRDAETRVVCPSPDGRFVAVEVTKEWKATPAWMCTVGSNLGQRVERDEVWILDRLHGTWSGVDMPFRYFCIGYRRGFEQGPWDANGRLSVLSSRNTFGGGETRAALLDPLTSSVVFAPLINIHMIECLEAESGLGAWYSTRRDPKTSEVTLSWEGRGVDLRLSDETVFAASPTPGTVFIQREAGLTRVEMATGAETHLRSFPFKIQRGQGLRVSPDGRHLAVIGDGNALILDAVDGHTVVELPPAGWLQRWSHVPGRLGIATVSQIGRERRWFVLNESGEMMPLPVDSWDCEELGTDSLLVFDRQHIECMKLDGSEREVLYEARP